MRSPANRATIIKRAFLKQAGAAVLVLAIASCAAVGGKASTTPTDRRDALRQLRDDTLKEFYATRPETRAELEGAVGYAVFDASQVNLVLYLGAMGAGVMVDNASGRETYMTMKRAGTGPGLGYKSYRQIMVFKDRKLFDTFTSVGADVGASADATLKTGSSKGIQLDGSTSFNPLMSVYQITDRGALLQANWGGVAYLPDTELNALKP
jgi:lipid-binding SYLF domain-containing protein